MLLSPFHWSLARPMRQSLWWMMSMLAEERWVALC